MLGIIRPRQKDVNIKKNDSLIATPDLYLVHSNFREAYAINYIIHEHVKMTWRSIFYFDVGFGPTVWSTNPASERLLHAGY